MIGHMDEAVGGRDYLEDAGRTVPAAHGGAPSRQPVDRPAFRILEVAPAAIREGHQVAVIMVAASRHDCVVGRELELAHHAAQHVLGHAAVIHHAQRLSGAAGGQSLLHLLHLALVEVVVQLHLGVSRELEGICLPGVEVQPDEELPHHEAQYVVESYHAGVAGGIVRDAVVTSHATGRDGQHGV